MGGGGGADGVNKEMNKRGGGAKVTDDDYETGDWNTMPFENYVIRIGW